MADVVYSNLNLITAGFFIFTASITGACLCKKKPEELLPAVFMVIISILYIFYCFDLLVYGFYLSIIFGGLTSFYVIFMAYSQMKQGSLKTFLLDKMLTPAMIIYGLALLLAIYLTHDSQVALWDELRLWAAYPKILFFTDHLQTGNDSLLYAKVQSYLPGMPLLVYFVQKCGAIFKDSHSYTVYAMFALSFLIPCLKGLKWKKDYLLVFPYSCLIFYIPLLFANSQNDAGDFYKSLFIDPILGIMAAYLFYLVTTNVYEDKFKTCNFYLTVFVMVLMKDSGILFAVMAVIASIWMESTRENDARSMKWICGLLIPAAAYLSWKIVLLRGGIHNSLAFNFSSLFNSTYYQSFFQAFFTIPIVKSCFGAVTKYLVPAFYTGIVILSCWIISKNLTPDKRNAFKKCVLCLFVSGFAFIIGLYILCVSAYEGRLLSYERYICTAIAAEVIFLILYCLSNREELWHKFSENNIAKSLILYCITILIVCFPFKTPRSNTGHSIYGSYEEAECYARDMADNISAHREGQGGFQSVYLVFEGDLTAFSWIHHRIYYNLLEHQIFVKNFYSDSSILNFVSAKNDIDTYMDMFLERLGTDGYDYVYFINVAEELNAHKSSMFYEDIRPMSLYEVNSKNGKTELVLIKD